MYLMQYFVSDIPGVTYSMLKKSTIVNTYDYNYRND